MRVKLWHFLVIALLSVPVGIVASQTALKNAAGVCKGTHFRKDFYKNIRHLEPANILEIVDYRLNYAIASDGSELGSLQIEVDWTRLPKDFGPKNHAGCYAIIFCEKHLVALDIELVDSKLCHTIKL